MRVLVAVVAVGAVLGGGGFAAAGEITLERISKLPADEQPAWRTYVARSQAAAKQDAAALASEVQAAGLSAALRAPDGDDFKLPAKGGDKWYASDAAGKLADVILSYQAPNGGWSKHVDYGQGPRKQGMQWTSQSAPGSRPHYLATIDNRSTTEQLQFLANVWQATRRADCQAACEQGLDYLLAAQYPCGGWPQVYPLEGGYHDNVTFNDNAMTHVLEVLQAVAAQEPRFAFVGPERRGQAAAAVARGIRYILAAQVVQQGRKTVWCAQHDALTLQPAPARALEPATLSGSESAGLLRFLMSIPNPSPELQQAIEDGLAWLEAAKIGGLTQKKVDGKTVYVPDPKSSKIYWARFYDLATGQPVFPGRNGVVYDSFTAMAADNHLGYDYFTTQPQSVLTTTQKKWRETLKRAAASVPGK